MYYILSIKCILITYTLIHIRSKLFDCFVQFKHINLKLYIVAIVQKCAQRHYKTIQHCIQPINDYYSPVWIKQYTIEVWVNVYKCAVINFYIKKHTSISNSYQKQKRIVNIWRNSLRNSINCKSLVYIMYLFKRKRVSLRNCIKFQYA